MDNPSNISVKTLLFIWTALLILTAVTIRIAGMDLGFLNIIVALTIATAKASLVVLFFMDLRHEVALFRYLLIIVFIILGLFMGLAYFDIGYRY